MASLIGHSPREAAVVGYRAASGRAKNALMQVPDDSDLERLTRWRDGDRKAGGQLLDRYFASIRRYFRQKFPDAYEDLLQETFSRIVENRDDFRGESSFKTYLFRIARYVGHEHIRKHYRQGGHFSPADSSLADLTGRRQSSILAEREDHRLLLDSLQHLSLEQQEVIVLYYWEQLTAKQVGEAIEAPESTVRSRLRLALRHLAKLHRRLGQQEHRRELSEDDIAQWLEALREEVGRAPTATT